MGKSSMPRERLAVLTVFMCMLMACQPEEAEINLTPSEVRTAVSTAPTAAATRTDQHGPTPTDDPRPLPVDCERRRNTPQFACIDPDTGLHYWLMPPDPQPDGSAPLLIYLHGFSHSGSALDLVRGGGVALEIEQGRRLALWTVSPQCPTGENWQSEAMVERLSGFVQNLLRTVDADPERVYLTGFSMGGDGAWALGLAHPEQYAAVVPVASWYEGIERTCALRDTPVWVFQSKQDELVHPRFAEAMTLALKSCNGDVQLTMYDEAGHELTSRLAYETDELYAWMMGQWKKKD